MVQSITLIIVLILGAVLYISLRNRVTAIEQQLIDQNTVNKHEHELLIKLYDQINKLTDGHNEVADALNNARKQSQSSDFDTYTSFNTPKGEA